MSEDANNYTKANTAEHWLVNGCAAQLSLAAVKSVLVEDVGVGWVIHSYGEAHTLSPQPSAAEGWRVPQNQEAVAVETTLELVRWCHFIQDPGESWSETGKYRNKERKLRFSVTFYCFKFSFSVRMVGK